VNRTEITLRWSGWPDVVLSIHCERTLASSQLHDVANLAASIEDMRDAVQADTQEVLP
jgi:hypothetical protein